MLAASLKQLTTQYPLEKISVADICRHCCLNRKSFYYHFQDKYDLINWIFDEDMTRALQEQTGEKGWGRIEQACRCLYDNRAFYAKAFLLYGQNSLTEHSRELILPLLRSKVEEKIGRDTHQIGTNLICDGFLCAIIRWISDKHCAQPKEFVDTVRKVVESMQTQ